MRHTQVKNWWAEKQASSQARAILLLSKPANNCLIVCADSMPPLTDKLHIFYKAHYCNNKKGIFNYKGDT